MTGDCWLWKAFERHKNTSYRQNKKGKKRKQIHRTTEKYRQLKLSRIAVWNEYREQQVEEYREAKTD